MVNYALFGARTEPKKQNCKQSRKINGVLGKYQQVTRRPGKTLQKNRIKAGKIEETRVGTKPKKLHDLASYQAEKTGSIYTKILISVRRY